MKIKQYLHITNLEEFVRGDYSQCFNLWDHPCNCPDWLVVSEIEIDVEINADLVIKRASASLDEKLDAAKLAVTVLEERKKELLALTWQRDLNGIFDDLSGPDLPDDGQEEEQ
jgi:hypothetical protein